MGKVALPELKSLGYAPSPASGALAAGGTLGILIPPSVALVIYAIIVEGSILQMFQATVLSGLLAVLGFIRVIAFQVELNPSLAPEPKPMDRDARRVAIRRLPPVIGIFGAIILGFGFGLFTPTPAASIGVFVIAVYGLLLRYFTGEPALLPADLAGRARPGLGLHDRLRNPSAEQSAGAQSTGGPVRRRRGGTERLVRPLGRPDLRRAPNHACRQS